MKRVLPIFDQLVMKKVTPIILFPNSLHVEETIIHCLVECTTKQYWQQIKFGWVHRKSMLAEYIEELRHNYDKAKVEKAL